MNSLKTYIKSNSALRGDPPYKANKIYFVKRIKFSVWMQTYNLKFICYIARKNR